MQQGTCESCGRDRERTVPVHRVYVHPPPLTDPSEPEPSDEERLEVLEEVEWWCAACCTNYPHEPAGDATP